jgi:hypothetical protein
LDKIKISMGANPRANPDASAYDLIQRADEAVW